MTQPDRRTTPEDHKDDLVSNLGPGQPQNDEIEEATPGRAPPVRAGKAMRERAPHDPELDTGGDAKESDRPELPQSSEEAFGISGEETTR